MSTAAVEQHLTELWETPKSVYAWFSTVDHKDLGIRYLVTAFCFLIIGGVEALLMRIQLTRANQAFLTPESYDQIFSMHGITMIFWYAAPILSGFAVYLVPLMIGARDMAFPRLNAFTYWSYLLSGILLYVAPLMGQAPHAGWFSYVPYTNIRYSPSHGMDFYASSADLSDHLNHRRGVELYCYHPASARARHGDQPNAAVPLQHAYHFLRHPVRTAGPHRRLCLSGTGSPLGNPFLRHLRGRQSHSLAAALLVFRPSLGLHYFPAGDGNAFADCSGIFTAARSSDIRSSPFRRFSPAWWGSASGCTTCLRSACRTSP